MINIQSRVIILLFGLVAVALGVMLAVSVWLNDSSRLEAEWVSPTAVSSTEQAQPVLPLNTAPPVTPLALAPPQIFTPIPVATATTLPSPTSVPTATPTETPTPDYSPTPPIWPTPINDISRTVRVPIIMYHYVSTPPQDADIYRIDLSIEPEALREQFVYLAENGFTTISLYDLSLAITNKKALPEKPIILTFDDGYLDNYENAYPLLEEFGFTGTFFIITDFADQNNPNHMSWDMLRELFAAGHSIENHTLSHPDLSQMSRDGMYGQIARSQSVIAEQIGHTPQYLCYPAGRYNETTIEVLQELDLWGAVTTRGGMWHGFDDRYEWRRVRISYSTTLADFARAIEPTE